MSSLIELTTGLHISEDSLLSKIATFVFVNTCNNTNYGTWCTDFDEIEDVFELPKNFIDDIFADKILDRINDLYGEMVADIFVNISDTPKCFDVDLYHDFIDGYIEDDQAIEENRKD